jgi:hypothetical protein
VSGIPRYQGNYIQREEEYIINLIQRIELKAGKVGKRQRWRVEGVFEV